MDDTGSHCVRSPDGTKGKISIHLVSPSIFTYTKLLTLIVVTKKALGVMSSKTESDIDILIISIIKENIDC